MQILYTLTEEEYNDLLVVKQSPDIILRDTNTALKKKLDAANVKLQQGAFDNSRVDTPFIVTNETLHFRSPTDFIIMYNSLAETNLTASDKSVYLQMQRISELFNYNMQFGNTSEVKAYRVNLQKKNIITGNVKVNKLVKLLTKD